MASTDGNISPSGHRLNKQIVSVCIFSIKLSLYIFKTDTFLALSHLFRYYGSIIHPILTVFWDSSFVLHLNSHIQN